MCTEFHLMKQLFIAEVPVLIKNKNILVPRQGKTPISLLNDEFV